MSKHKRPRHSDQARREHTRLLDEGAEPARKSRGASLAAPFYLAVDRQLKSGYDTYEKSEKVALTIKKQHPRLYVTVYETGTGRHIEIERPKLAVSNGKRPQLADGDTMARAP